MSALAPEGLEANVCFPPRTSHERGGCAIPIPEWRLLAKTDIERSGLE